MKYVTNAFGRIDLPGNKGNPSGKSRAIAIDAVLGVIALCIIFAIAPDYFQNVVFDLGLRNLALLFPCIPLGYLVWRYLSDRYTNHRRIVTGMIVLGLFAVSWFFGLKFTRDYFTFLAYGQYQSRPDLVQVDPDVVRFTPLENACVDLSGAISTSSEHIECKHVVPLLSKGHHFGYVAPITPSGFLQTFAMNNPGYEVLDDSAAVADDPKRRIRRIDDPQMIGLGMEWFDNLERRLVFTDFFAKFEHPHYLVLDPTKPDKLTAVVSKIKFSHFFQLPYWAGVALVHSDGTIESLSKEAALSDPCLKGQWIYPMALDQKYVNLQDYRVGWGPLSPIVRVPGKLEIEKLPGDNQFPFLMQGLDGNPYLVTATKGEGSARGLFRMYFRNAHTGEGSYHEFKQDEVVYGAGAALGRATNISGYNWKQRHGDSTSGTTIAVEPVYFTRPGESVPYWKFTVTNQEFAGISATIVSHGSRPDDMKIFRTRVEFEAWKKGGELKPKTVAPAGVGSAAALSTEDAIRGYLDRIDAEVLALRKLLGEKK